MAGVAGLRAALSGPLAYHCTQPRSPLSISPPAPLLDVAARGRSSGRAADNVGILRCVLCRHMFCGRPLPCCLSITLRPSSLIPVLPHSSGFVGGTGHYLATAPPHALSLKHRCCGPPTSEEERRLKRHAHANQTIKKAYRRQSSTGAMAHMAGGGRRKTGVPIPLSRCKLLGWRQWAIVRHARTRKNFCGCISAHAYMRRATHGSIALPPASCTAPPPPHLPTSGLRTLLHTSLCTLCLACLVTHLFVQYDNRCAGDVSVARAT